MRAGHCRGARCSAWPGAHLSSAAWMRGASSRPACAGAATSTAHDGGMTGSVTVRLSWALAAPHSASAASAEIRSFIDASLLLSTAMVWSATLGEHLAYSVPLPTRATRRWPRSQAGLANMLVLAYPREKVRVTRSRWARIARFASAGSRAAIASTMRRWSASVSWRSSSVWKCSFSLCHKWPRWSHR